MVGVGEDGGVILLDVGEDVVDGFDEEALDYCCFFKSLACFLLCFVDFSISKSSGKGVPVRKVLGINNYYYRIADKGANLFGGQTNK